jgi:hypothetical protein
MPLLSCKQQAKTGPLACGGPGSAMHHSLALALHRIRDTQVSDAFATPIHFSNSPPRSRDAFCARAFAFCFAHPDRGVGGAPRDVRVFARHPLDVPWRVLKGVHARLRRAMDARERLSTRHVRRLRGALRPMTRRTIGGNNATISTISAASVPIVSQTAVRRGHRMHGSFAVRLWHHRRDASRADRCGARQPARALIAACVRT